MLNAKINLNCDDALEEVDLTKPKIAIIGVG
jgi:hypothetical protein